MVRRVRVTLFALGLVITVALGLGLYFRMERIRAEADTSAVERKNADSRKRLARLLERIADVESGNEGLKKSFADLGGAELAAREEHWRAWLARAQAVRNSPKFRRMRDQRNRAIIDQRYAAFFRAAHLSPGEISAFEKLTVDFEEKTGSLPAQGTPASAASNPGALDAQAEYAANVRALLGEATFEAMQDYDRTEPARAVADELAGQVYFTDSPLSADQATQLEAAIMANRSTDPSQGDSINWQGVLAQVGAALAPAQIAGLQAIQAERLYQYRVDQAMGAQMVGAGTP